MGLLSDYLASKRSQQAARSANRFSEHMSSTAYQRGMLDMRKAGLNPMLAYSQGGATAPSGAVASMQSTGDVAQAAIGGVQANTAKKLGKSTRTLQDQQKQTLGTQAQVNTETAQKVANDAQLSATQNKLHELQIPGAKLDAEIASSPEGRAYRFGEKAQKVGKFGGYVGSAIEAMKNASRLRKWKAPTINKRQPQRSSQ